MNRDYAMFVTLVPLNELRHVKLSDGSMSVQIAMAIRGDQLECAAMLQNMAADVMTSINNELSKGSTENAA